MDSNEDKFEYFMDRTERDLDYIRGKLDSLIGFRWMMIGMSTAISAIVSFIVAIWKH